MILTLVCKNYDAIIFNNYIDIYNYIRIFNTKISKTQLTHTLNSISSFIKVLGSLKSFRVYGTDTRVLFYIKVQD